MNNNQRKKTLSLLHNLRRDEALAYKMDAEMHPKPKHPLTATERYNKRKAKEVLIMARILAGVPEGWNSP